MRHSANVVFPPYLLGSAGAVDDTPPFTFPRHVHSRDEVTSSNIVSPTLMSRPAYHTSSARSLTAFQQSSGNGQLQLQYFAVRDTVKPL